MVMILVRGTVTAGSESEVYSYTHVTIVRPGCGQHVDQVSKERLDGSWTASHQV